MVTAGGSLSPGEQRIVDVVAASPGLTTARVLQAVGAPKAQGRGLLKTLSERGVLYDLGSHHAGIPSAWYLAGSAPSAAEREWGNYKQWCSELQVVAIDALVAHGTMRAAAAALGMTEAALESRLRRARKALARKGWAPEEGVQHPTPEGFGIDRISTYYNKQGEPTGKWVKQKVEEEHKVQLVLEALSGVIEPMRGASTLVSPPENPADELLVVYPMGDPHLGMYAWFEETGNTFNLELAEDQLFAAADELVAAVPVAKTALICNLGDFFHTDTVRNVTMRSGHTLDVDTRWGLILKTGVKLMRRIIDRAKEKHTVVHVINEIGNHDDHSAMMLSMTLAAFYENDPRVHIDTSPQPFHWHVFGKNLIGVTHGNNTKPHELLGVMAVDQKEAWGATTHRYWYTGHIHHDTLKELPGCTVETFRTLAGRDSAAHRMGYRSGRDMKADLIHKDYGRIRRYIVGLDQLGFFA